MQKGKLDLWNFTLRKNRLSKPNNNIKGILLLRIEIQYARFKQKELFIRLKKGRSDQTRRARTQQNIETVCLFVCCSESKNILSTILPRDGSEPDGSDHSSYIETGLETFSISHSSETKIDCTR